MLTLEQAQNLNIADCRIVRIEKCTYTIIYNYRIIKSGMMFYNAYYVGIDAPLNSPNSNT